MFGFEVIVYNTFNGEPENKDEEDKNSWNEAEFTNIISNGF